MIKSVCYIGHLFGYDNVIEFIMKYFTLDELVVLPLINNNITGVDESDGDNLPIKRISKKTKDTDDKYDRSNDV